MAAGRRAPHPAVAPMLTDRAAVGVARARRSRRSVDEWARPVRTLRIGAVTERDPDVPGRCCVTDPAAAGRPVRPRRLVGARRPARRHRRHAQRHRARSRLRRRRSGSRLAARRRGRRVRAGQGHRRRGPPRRAAASEHGRAVGVVGNGLDAPYPRSNAELWEAVARRRPAAVGVAAGHGARAVPVPAAQPHPRRAQRGARGRREPRARRIADHGARGARAVGRGDGRARVGAQPGRRRHQPAAPRRRRAGHRRRRRAGRARARPPAGRRAGYDPRPLPRGDRGAACSSAAGPTRARSTTSSPTSACRSPRRR